MFVFLSLQNYTRMKKISYYLPFLLLFTTLVFISCDDEQLEGEFFSTPDGSDPEVFCQETGPLAIAEAQLALLGLDPSEAQAGCDAFIATINSFINTCGDEGGGLQLLLDELGTDCNLTTDGGDGDDDDDDGTIDPIVGEWALVRSVDFFNDMENEFLANDCSEQSRQIFEENGSYSFTMYDIPNSECMILSSTESGTWANMNGNYQANYDNECIGVDCTNSDEPSSITLVNQNTLRIQFNGETVDGELVEFFFREYTRL